MVKMTMVTIEGSAAEVSEVGQKLGLTASSTEVSVEGEIVGGPQPQPEQPPKPKARRSRKQQDKPPTAAEARASQAEADSAAKLADEQEDEGEAEGGSTPKGDGTGKFPISAAELADAKRLHHVVDRIMKKGVEDVNEIVAICEALKDQVPLLGRVKDLDRRVRSAYEVAIS